MDAVYRVEQSKVVHEVFDDEIVIVNLDTGNYYSTRAVGAEIWKQVVDGASREGILQGLTHRYPDEAAEVVQQQTRAFLEELARENLAVAVPVADTMGAGAAQSPAAAGARFARPTLDKYTDMEKLLLVDPIHQVDEMGWPSRKPN